MERFGIKSREGLSRYGLDNAWTKSQPWEVKELDWTKCHPEGVDTLREWRWNVLMQEDVGI